MVWSTKSRLERRFPGAMSPQSLVVLKGESNGRFERVRQSRTYALQLRGGVSERTDTGSRIRRGCARSDRSPWLCGHRGCPTGIDVRTASSGNAAIHRCDSTRSPWVRWNAPRGRVGCSFFSKPSNDFASGDIASRRFDSRGAAAKR